MTHINNDTTILNLIKKHKGAASTIELAEELQKLGLSPEAARKAISRTIAKDHIRSLPGMNLKSGGRIVYNPLKTSRHDLYNAIIRSKSGYSEVLRVLKAYGGTLPITIMKTHSFLTVQPRKKRLSFNEVINVLRGNHFIRTYEDVVQGEMIELENTLNPHEGIKDSQITVEQVFLEMFVKWAINSNFVSPGKVQIRTIKEAPEFGGYAWDVVSPSYLSNLRTYNTEKITPGFFVGDIWLRENISEYALIYFFAKLEAIRGNAGNRPILPFFVFNSLDSGTLNLLRSKGVMTVHAETFFGKKFGRALMGIWKSLEDIRNSVVNHPAQTADLFKIVLEMTGQNNNLKSSLFEFIIARLAVLKGEYLTGIRHKLKDSASVTLSDADVFTRVGKEKIKIYECKSLSAKNLYSKDDLKDWSERVLPRILKWFKDHKESNSENPFLEIEFCVTTDFHEECSDLMTKLQGAKKYKLSFFTGAALIKELREKKEYELLEVFENTLMHESD